jgi:hypothetical protein
MFVDLQYNLPYVGTMTFEQIHAVAMRTVCVNVALLRTCHFVDTCLHTLLRCLWRNREHTRVFATKYKLENLSSTTSCRAVEGRALAEIKRLSAQEPRRGLLLDQRRVLVDARRLG